MTLRRPSFLFLEPSPVAKSPVETTASLRRDVWLGAIRRPSLSAVRFRWLRNARPGLAWRSAQGLEHPSAQERGTWRTGGIWRPAKKAADIPDGVHLHDLRHTGNHLAAASGASTKDLMTRMGHSSMRAALIYQHATEDRDRAIADTLDRLIQSGTGR